MGIVLIFEAGEQEYIIEYHVLKMLIRDFLICYTKKEVPSSNKNHKFFEFKFYCKQNQVGLIAYSLGILMQTMMEFNKGKEGILKSTHIVYKEFPDCIRIKI